jgi:hypothetical protein
MTARAALVAAAALTVAGLPAGAGPGSPGPDYFAGLYERVGRDRFGLPLNDRVRIDPEGQGLSVEGCSGGALRLGFAPWSLGENFLSGRAAAGEVFVCQFHNDGDNRPIFNCRSGEGSKLTLWPVEGDFRGGTLAC